MARGNNQTIPSGTGILTKTLSGDVRQSITVLNPNDGILYVVQNSTANATTWDFVIPSQSYGALPGPWESIGLYYVDQSGAGRPGNVTVFESDNKLEVPLFQAIGIARLAEVSTMDVVEGAIPANPGAGIARLWVDTSNFLHILTPGGTDYTVADTGTALGGVLTGSLPNPGMAAGVASANIGAITGDLAGTLPNLTINADAVTHKAFAQLATAANTTSTTPALLETNSFTTQVAGGFVRSDWRASFIGSLTNQVANFYVRVDGGAWTNIGRLTIPASSLAFPISILFDWINLSATAHTFDIGWSTSGGTLTLDSGVYHSWEIIELKR